MLQGLSTPSTRPGAKILLARVSSGGVGGAPDLPPLWRRAVSERLMWERYLKPSLHRPPTRFARKLQDRFVPGLPDIAYCCEGAAGWLELKWLKRWPRRVATVDVGLTPAQARWLQGYRDADGCAYVLLGVGETHEWLLFADVGAVLGRVRRTMLEDRAEARGSLGDILPLARFLIDRPV